MNLLQAVIASWVASVGLGHGKTSVPTILSDHMVLQQQQADPIWGWDQPGVKVTVQFGGQTKVAETDGSGKWRVVLDPMVANASPQSMTIQGTDRLEIRDILVGEVWVCSGQSNMEWPLSVDWNGDMEAMAAHDPLLRMVSIPKTGTQEAQTHFQGQWQASEPKVATQFSAVGYYYGQYLRKHLQVPVGLIDNAWGGSAAEAWVPRESLQEREEFADLLARTKAKEEQIAATASDKPNPWLSGNARPGNLYQGVLNPIIGYGIKGVIWYQGESNAERAWEYRSLFPHLIQQWRKVWQQGDFPFYWVQLADFKDEKSNPSESDWAELREAQTLTLKLPNTGQAVTIDLGEAKDIHPKSKQFVAARLARWALAKSYGQSLLYRSPEYQEMRVENGAVVVKLNLYGGKLRPFDVNVLKGFTICGADRVWVPAQAKVVQGDQIHVSSPKVAEPVAVRYAWANNPVTNLTTEQGLPVTPFRTDDFPLTTQNPAKPKE